MTFADAIEQIRQVGTIRLQGAKLKLRFPEVERGRLEAAFETLRQNRNAALAHLAGESELPAAFTETPISYQEWKARELNRLFDELGVPGPSRPASGIKAETLRHGVERETRGNGKS